MSNFKVFLHGLGAAVISGLLSGASGAVAGAVTNPALIASKAGLISIGAAALAGALTSAVTYLKTSPLDK